MYWAPWCPFKLKIENKQKSTLKKVFIFSRKTFFIYFRKWNSAAQRLKSSFIFSKKLFLYIEKRNPLNFLYFLKKIFLIFREMELSRPKIKNFFYFLKNVSGARKKFRHIDGPWSVSETFLWATKNVLMLFLPYFYSSFF